jgi:hypothetical protein
MAQAVNQNFPPRHFIFYSSINPVFLSVKDGLEVTSR